MGKHNHKPIVSLLLNLTGQEATPGKHHFTVCNTENVGCDVSFDALLLAERRSAERIPSYLLNGNKFPMVSILLETRDYDGVWRLFVPQQSIKHGKELTEDGIQFIKNNLVGIVMLGADYLV